MASHDRRRGDPELRADRALGMDRPISRRDFLGGVGVAIASSVIPNAAGGDTSQPMASGSSAPASGARSAPYPPTRSGLRGNHLGSFEVAHEMAMNGRTDWGSAADPDGTVYDLVVVGAGVSGLSAAYFYREQYPRAKILLLDNHDDFGGHAKRNEFRIGDQTILGYGGSQSLESPSDYSDTAKGLLEALGVDVDGFYDYYDRKFFVEHGLGAGVYFDRATYGVDRLVIGQLSAASAFLGLSPSDLSIEQFAAQMPISEEARRQFIALNRMSEDRLPDVSILGEADFLGRISYLDFLRDHLGIRDPEVLGIFQNITNAYYGFGIDAVPAAGALSMGLPGLGGTSLRWFGGLTERLASWFIDPYIFHFPDGNASIARLLVRSLIPDAAPGSTMEDIVEAQFDYSMLDQAGEITRLRLNSTVVHAANDGPAQNSTGVSITYVRHGQTFRVKAKSCVLACYNMAIPYLCPELPTLQAEALAELVKAPLIYTNVLVENWNAWKTLGLGFAYCPGSYHTSAMIDFPVSIGGYRFSGNPDEPVIIQMMHVPTKPGLSTRDQHRHGRAQMLATSFESIERHTRNQLAGIGGPAGFEPGRDIAAITVNRWPHGYAYEHNPLFDPDPEKVDPPWVTGRQRFGRIAIANSDAGGRAYIDCAIDEARRAVNDLS